MIATWLAIALTSIPVPAAAHDEEPDEPPAVATPHDPLPNAMCPVTTDEAVDPEIFTEYEGRRVYFCCARCRRRFLKDPSAFETNLTRFAVAEEGAEREHEDHEHDQGHGEGLAHDHARDHGEEAGFPARAVRFAGKLHPIVVHFPIGLLIGALATELLTALGLGVHFRQASRALVLLGAPAAVVAAAFGWAAGWGASYPGDLCGILGVHRWLGTATAALAIVTLLGSERMHRRGAGRRAYLTALVLLATLVGVTGHFGGTLIFGTDHLRF